MGRKTGEGGEKSRYCFSTGGWCPVRGQCINFQEKCKECIQFSKFKERKIGN